VITVAEFFAVGPVGEGMVLWFLGWNFDVCVIWRFPTGTLLTTLDLKWSVLDLDVLLTGQVQVHSLGVGSVVNWHG
jgi:hypothetical protein